MAYSFLKTDALYPLMKTSDKTSLLATMTPFPGDTPDIWKHLNWSVETTGGQEWPYSSRTTLPAVLYTSKWKSTCTPQPPAFSRSRHKQMPYPFHKSLVTSSLTSLNATAVTTFLIPMVVVDHRSSKGVISIPCNKMINATQTAQNYIDYVYWQFGLPDSFLSDRGLQFNSHIFKKMMRLLGVKTLWSTAYHPQTDEETERVNQELEIYFWIFCTNNPKTWKSLNPLMEFSHNQKVHSVTIMGPYYVHPTHSTFFFLSFSSISTIAYITILRVALFHIPSHLLLFGPPLDIYHCPLRHPVP